MSSRKRPLAEISQPHSTPTRYAPSTPHAIRALQQRSGAKTRSARSIRRINTNVVRPDSIRGVLRQFAKISAPITKKRIATSNHIYADKENQRPDNAPDHDNDSLLLDKPNLTFRIEEGTEDDDSELPVPPTPTALVDEEDYEQPTETFQNVTAIPINRPASEFSGRRKSRVSLAYSEPISVEEQNEQDPDMTIMTERGRRALSEEATGRLSRYSFGSIHMSDFGTELEVRRNSERYTKMAQLDLDDYVAFAGDDLPDIGDTENLEGFQRSPSFAAGEDTVHVSAVGDETFRLDLPQTEEDLTTHEANAASLQYNKAVAVESNPHSPEVDPRNSTDMRGAETDETSRRQTLLEKATTSSHTSRRKRVKLTRHGTTVPSMPSSLIKRVVLNSYEKQSKRKPKLGQDHMKALEQATEWFFEQVGEDLAAYSDHGRRKKRVDTDDVLLLMRRQKVLEEDGELPTLAKNWLPKDVLDCLDLPDSV